MKLKNVLKVIAIGVFLIVIGVLFVHIKNPQGIIQAVKIPRDLQLFINEENVLPDSDNSIFILTKTLSPSFRIAPSKGVVKQLRIDGISLLSDNTLIENHSIKDDVIEFTPAFLLKPGKHTLEISLDNRGLKTEGTYTLILGFKPNLGVDIDKSEFFLIPDSTRDIYKKSWFSTENETIKIDPINGGRYASLAFLYPFSDIDLIFRFKAQGMVTNLTFYFLGSGRTFVIGNGNNSKMTLLRNNNESIEGNQFVIEPHKEYSVHIIRSGSYYQMFLKPSELPIDWQRVIDFRDEIDASIDSVGFSVWPGSKGIEILDVTLFPNKL